MSANVGSLFIDIGIDFKKFDRDISSVINRVKKLQGDFSKMGLDIGESLGNNISKGLEDKTGNIGDKIKSIGKDENILRDEGKKIGEEFGRGIEDGVDNPTRNIGKKLSDSLGGVFKGMESFGKKGMRTVTAPIMAGATYMFKTDMDITDATAKLETLSGRTHEILKTETYNLSNLTGRKMKEVAEAQYLALSSGVSDDNLGAFMVDAGKTAKAGFAGLEETVDGLTTVLNSYGLATQNTSKIADQMFIAQNLGKTTIGEMASSIGKVTPLASELGVTTNELFSSMAALTKSGLDTSESITGLKAVFSNIVKPNEKAIELTKSLGIEFNTAHLRSVGWKTFLDEIVTKTGGSKEAIESMFGSTSALNAILSLTGEGANTFNQAMDEMANKSGQVNEAYEKLQTKGENLRKGWNRLVNSFTKHGGIFDELESKVVRMINSLALALDKITPEQATNIANIALTFAMFFPAIRIVSLLGNSTLKLGKGIGWVAEKLMEMGGSTTVVTGGLASVSIAGLAVVGMLGYLIYSMWTAEDESITSAQGIGDNFEKLAMRTEGLVQFVGGGIMSIGTLIVGGFSMMIEVALSKINGFLAGAKNLADKLGLDWLSDTIGGGVSSIDGAIGKLSDSRKDMANTNIDIFENALAKMNNPMDMINKRRYEKGKIEVEFSGVRTDSKGNLTKEYLAAIEEDNKKKRNLGDLFNPEYSNDTNIGIKTEDLIDPEIEEILNSFFNNTDDGIKKTASSVKSSTDKMADAIKKLGDEFRSTSDGIKNSIGMFDRFKSKTTSAYKLLRNARERDKAINERESILQSLSNRGINQDVMADLYKTDINQLGNLKGLDRMNEDQLKEWVSLQVSTNSSADRQAQNQIVNITINTNSRDRNAKQFAEEIHKELRMKGITIF